MNEPRRLKHGGGAAQRLLDSASLDRAGEESRARVAALVSTSSAFSQSTRVPAAPRSALQTFARWAAIGAAASVALGFAVSSLSSTSEPPAASHVAAAPEVPPVSAEITAEQPRAQQSDLRELEPARTAIARGDAKAALDALDALRAPAGNEILSGEATVLRVRALLLDGRRAEARALAQSFSREHPASPQNPRLEALTTSSYGN